MVRARKPAIPREENILEYVSVRPRKSKAAAQQLSTNPGQFGERDQVYDVTVARLSRRLPEPGEPDGKT